MRIEQISYVLNIVKYGSLSSTAEKLYINQPTLSRAIHTLEDELGMPLFERTHQGMIPTSLCKKLTPHFENILLETECINNIVEKESEQDITGEITIVATAMICNNILLDIIEKYNEQYPLVTVNVSEQYANKIIDEVYNDLSLVGVLSYAPMQERQVLYLCDSHHLTFEPIFTTPLSILLPSNSPLAEKDFLTNEDLLNYPHILNKKVSVITESFHTSEEELNNIHYCYDRDSRNKMIIKNNGYAVISPLEMKSDPYLESNMLVLKPFYEQQIGVSPMTVGIVYDKAKKMQDYEIDFIDQLRLILKKNAQDSDFLELQV